MGLCHQQIILPCQIQTIPICQSKPEEVVLGPRLSSSITEVNYSQFSYVAAHGGPSLGLNSAPIFSTPLQFYMPFWYNGATLGKPPKTTSYFPLTTIPGIPLDCTPCKPTIEISSKTPTISTPEPSTFLTLLLGFLLLIKRFSNSHAR